MHSSMRLATYRCLQIMALAQCAVTSLVFAQAPRNMPPNPTMADVLMAVGVADWLVVAGLSLSFGLVSLLQRFKRSEAGTHYGRFIAAHMSGSLSSGVLVYLVTQGTIDSPNRFWQALAIGAAGWGGSTVADMIAARINKGFVERQP